MSNNFFLKKKEDNWMLTKEVEFDGAPSKQGDSVVFEAVEE